MVRILPPLLLLGLPLLLPLLLLGLPLVHSNGSPREKFRYAFRRIQDPDFLESAALEGKGGTSNYLLISICWCTSVMVCTSAQV